MINQAGNENTTVRKTCDLPIIQVGKRDGDFVSPKDRISETAFTGAINAGEETDVRVIKKTKTRPDICAQVLIDCSEMENVIVSGRRQLTLFDREVHDAIATLYVECGYRYVTTNMIYQVMTGKRDCHGSERQRNAIWESLTKLMFTHVVINASDEARFDKRVTQVQFDSNMINIRRTRFIMNGHETDGIEILAAPILYEYGNQKDQVARFDCRWMNTPTNKNEETIILEGFLRRRIITINHEKKFSPVIRFEQIYGLYDLTEMSDRVARKKKCIIRGTVKTVLDHYKKQGIIRGYEILQDRGTIVSVKILRGRNRLRNTGNGTP